MPSQTRQPNLSSAFLRTDTDDNHFVRRRKELRPAFESPRAAQIMETASVFNKPRYSMVSPYGDDNILSQKKQKPMTPQQSNKKIGMRSALKFAEGHQRAAMDMMVNHSTQASSHCGAQDMPMYRKTQGTLPNYEQSRPNSKLSRPKSAAFIDNLTLNSQNKFKQIRQQQNREDAADFCAPLPQAYKLDEETGKRITTGDLLQGYLKNSKNVVTTQKHKFNQKYELPWFHEQVPLTKPIWELSKPLRDTQGVSKGETDFRYNFYKCEEVASTVGAPSVVSKMSAKRLRTAEQKSKTQLANKVHGTGARTRRLKWTQTNDRNNYSMKVAKNAGDYPVFERHDYWDTPQGPFAKVREGLAYKDTDTRNFPPKNIYQNTPLSTSQSAWKYSQYDQMLLPNQDGSAKLTTQVDKIQFRHQDDLMAYTEMKLWHAKKWDGSEYLKVPLPKKM